MSNKCIFLDRDGVLNRDRLNYAYQLEHFEILPGVPKALYALKSAGYLLIVITNQSGIAKGIYSREDMEICHQYFQQQTRNSIDAFYFAPYHPSVTESLTRKPDSLMFEKAIARYEVDVGQSWMIGDKERDLVPAYKLGIRSILLDKEKPSTRAMYTVESLLEASRKIL